MATGLVVGGWFASSIVSNLITSLISYVKEDQSKRQLGLKAELKRLEKALPKIQAVMDVVDSCHIKEENPELARWLWQFRDAVNEAEDFIDEMDYYQLEEEIKGKKSKVSHAASRLKTIFERAVRKDTTLERLKNIVKGLDEVAADVGHFVNLVDKLKHKQPSNTSNRDTSSLLPVEHKVVGRDDEKDNLINKLLSFSSASVRRNFSILPIVGVGGIGKTTLAQFVYNDKRIEKHFRRRIWVCVSNNFDVLSLTKKIYESLKLHQNHTIDNLDLLQREILESLKSKTIPLVLDDVWNDDDRESWGKLLAPFSSVEGGSMVLLTTRMGKITKMMTGTMEPIFLRGLSEKNYWDFFKNCAFGGEDPKNYNKLQDIGKKIVKKLKGSPLAAKTVGGILRNNLDDEHWEDILNSEIWELEQSQNDIMPALRLSYQHLSSHLKPCFRFCSIFHQDYEFDKEQIIYMWVALGLVRKPMKGNRRPEDIGHEYFDDLVKKSFFDCKKTRYAREHYVMHDLLHELAELVSQGECFRIDESSGSKSIPTSIRHLSISNSVALPIPEIIKLKNLRTLLINSDSSEEDILKVLKGLKSLCILVVRNFNIIDDCISSLIHLRYLANHDISYVPKSVNKLYHLQFLYYHGSFSPDFSNLTADSIGNLINLRILSTPNTRRGKTSGIGRLTSLQILERFIVAVNGNNFLELKNLRELRELGIENLKNVSRVEDIFEANLKEKEHIQKLTLKWTEGYNKCSRSPEVDEQVLDTVEPHSNLKKLIIEYYMGRRSPHWMSLQSLSKLVSIQLENCDGWEDLSPLGQLPYLESLQLYGMRSLKSVGSAPDRGTEVCVFPSLKELRIENMLALEEFYGGATQWLPCLKTLEVSNCPKLRVFPNLPCGLSKLSINNVSWVTLPQLWHDQGEASSSSSSLSSLEIYSCGDLVSLAEGLLLHPQLFTSLVKLDIRCCSELTHLPIGGFGKFTSLKELMVTGCPKLRNSSTSGRFLPSSLHYLYIFDCYALDPLPNKAPQDLDFLPRVIIVGCTNIKSLPLAEVLERWKALEHLSIKDCSQLESLGGLQALPSLKYLKVIKCPSLVADASSSLSTSLAEHPSSSTSLILDEIHIDDPSLLCTVPLKSISARNLHLECCMGIRSSALEEWALKNRTLLQALYIRDVSSWQFPLEELQSLCCLQVLEVFHCRELQSLPKLPSSLKTLWLDDCPPELEERCLQDSGPDWPNIQHIPKVQIGKYDKETLAAITLQEHNRRTRE
ncbi:putative disease resistance RPP13-like protein 1 isoform X1 [Typha angustifolia]|uniref:putative disease resistance RPP13-like protein 1 isoform X1 n=1 Tax=Typha angustifolia TaxID=59011 RepID=UPI003C30AD65